MTVALKTQPAAEADPGVYATVHPPRRRWGWALGAVGVGVVAVAALVGTLRGDDAPAWQTAPAVVGDVVRHVTAVGTLEAVDVVAIGSEQSGVVASVEVEVNDRVVAGQILATLDPEPFDADVASARAQVASARAQLAQAEVNQRQADATRARSEVLIGRDATTAVALEADRLAAESAAAAVDVARASLDQARAALTKAERSRSDAVIVSPIDGVVLARNVDAGQTVVSTMSATTLFSVAADLSSMEVEVAVDEADVGAVSAGDRATFTVPAWPDRVFTAEVVRVDLAPSEAAVVTYPTLLRIDNLDGALRPGLTATASIEVARWDDVVTVPAAALRFEPGGGDPYLGDVYVAPDRPGEAPVAVAVQVLGSSGATYAVAGLAEGTRVVIGGGE
jgi:HlyD family secretion protein